MASSDFWTINSSEVKVKFATWQDDWAADFWWWWRVSVSPKVWQSIRLKKFENTAVSFGEMTFWILLMFRFMIHNDSWAEIGQVDSYSHWFVSGAAVSFQCPTTSRWGHHYSREKRSFCFLLPRSGHISCEHVPCAVKNCFETEIKSSSHRSWNLSMSVGLCLKRSPNGYLDENSWLLGVISWCFTVLRPFNRKRSW